MASNILGVCLLFFLMFLVEASMDGICNRTELTGETKLVRKWKYVNRRRKTYMAYEEVTKTILECCKGYLRRDKNFTSLSSTETPPICIPQCEPPCTNGVCMEPNVCKCFPGYGFRNETCQPVCSEPCNNGTCVEPETCKCLPGYRMTDVNVCTPVCSMGCGNGSCISPEVCHCNDGYTMKNVTCEPKCWPPCQTGECIAPNTCSCGPGYELIMSNITSCEPICSPACKNGVCVGPNICMCDRGFEWRNETCQPVCSEPCVNGSCIAPDTCECFEGYNLNNSNHVCIPTCTNGCGFGRCISPEVCLCYGGFSWINGTCKPVCSPPCENGVCTLSFDCHCNPGYKLQNGTCEPESKRFYSDTTRKTVTYANDEHDERTIWTRSYPNNEITLPEMYTTGHSLPLDKVHKSPIPWMYYVIPILAVLIIVLVVILTWKRHSIVEFCAGRSYVVSGEMKHTSNKNIPDVTFSAMQERQARRDGTNAEKN